MIETAVRVYIITGVWIAMFWPMAREAFVDDVVFWRREGETGVQFIGKMALVAVFWPIPATAFIIYLFRTFVEPWFTEPA